MQLVPEKTTVREIAVFGTNKLVKLPRIDWKSSSIFHNN